MSQYWNDFTDYTAGGGLPSDMTVEYGGSSYWDVASESTPAGGQYLAYTGGDVTVGISWDGVDESPETVEVACLMRGVDGFPYGVTHIFGSGTQSSNSGYMFVHGMRSFDDSSFIRRYDDGTVNPLAEIPTDGSMETWYWTRFRYEAGTLYAKYWEEGGTEPTSWQVQADDSTYTSGFIGLGVAHGSETHFSAFSVGTGGDKAPLEEPSSGTFGTASGTGFGTGSASGVTERAELSWDAVDGADGYRVERTTASNPSYPEDYTVRADGIIGTTYTDYGLPDADEIEYAVIAYGQNGESELQTDVMWYGTEGVAAGMAAGTGIASPGVTSPGAASGSVSTSSAAQATAVHTASASGSSSGGGSAQAQVVRPASASGGATGAGGASAARRRAVTASGRATGAGSGLPTSITTASASGALMGTGVAVGGAIRSVQADGVGTGSGTALATRDEGAFYTRAAAGAASGTGSASAMKTTAIMASASGTGAGTGQASSVVYGLLIASASGVGTGTGSANVLGNVIRDVVPLSVVWTHDGELTVTWTEGGEVTVTMNDNEIDQEVVPATGESIRRTITVEDDREPKDLSGASVEWYLLPDRHSTDDDSIIDHESEGVVISVAEAEAGEVSLTVEEGITEDLAGRHWQRFVVNDSSSSRQSWGGYFRIVAV